MLYKIISEDRVSIVKLEMPIINNSLCYRHYYDIKSKHYLDLYLTEIERQKTGSYYKNSQITNDKFFRFSPDKYEEITDKEARKIIPIEYHIHFFSQDLQILIKQILYG